MSNENIWSSVMWEGWYRVYAAPDRKTVDKFILALKSWLEKRNPFAFCFVADKAVMDANITKEWERVKGMNGKGPCEDVLADIKNIMIIINSYLINIKLIKSAFQLLNNV